MKVSRIFCSHRMVTCTSCQLLNLKYKKPRQARDFLALCLQSDFFFYGQSVKFPDAINGFDASKHHRVDLPP